MTGRATASLIVAAALLAVPAAGAATVARSRVPRQSGTASSASDSQPTGCTRGGGSFRTHGSRHRKRVALTFDDGPSPYTPKVLRVLERFDAHATFFEIGQEVPGHAATLHHILDEGSEIGNHTMHHDTFPSEGDLVEANRTIKRVSGFRPCLFRPPGGEVDGALIQRARDAELTTINWDVDPRDWSTPGTGAIVTRVTGAVRPGSIVVMHDGGGNRSETVAALPAILRKLNHRGYEFETVTELLHHEFTFE